MHRQDGKPVVALVLLSVLAQARQQSVERRRRHELAVDRDVGLPRRRKAIEEALVQRPAPAHGRSSS